MTELTSETWTAERLDAFLRAPKKFVNKTKMVFAGLKKQTDRNNLIAWLAQQADDPISFEALGLATAGATALPPPVDNNLKKKKSKPSFITILPRQPMPNSPTSPRGSASWKRACPNSITNAPAGIPSTSSRRSTRPATKSA